MAVLRRPKTLHSPPWWGSCERCSGSRSHPQGNPLLWCSRRSRKSKSQDHHLPGEDRCSRCSSMGWRDCFPQEYPHSGACLPTHQHGRPWRSSPSESTLRHHSEVSPPDSAGSSKEEPQELEALVQQWPDFPKSGWNQKSLGARAGPGVAITDEDSGTNSKAVDEGARGERCLTEMVSSKFAILTVRLSIGSSVGPPSIKGGGCTPAVELQPQGNPLAPQTTEQPPEKPDAPSACSECLAPKMLKLHHSSTQPTTPRAPPIQWHPTGTSSRGWTKPETPLRDQVKGRPKTCEAWSQKTFATHFGLKW